MKANHGAPGLRRLAVGVCWLLLVCASAGEGTECLQHPKVCLRRLSGQVFSGRSSERYVTLDDVELTAQGLGGMEKWPPPVTVRTDADGRFDFGKLNAGVYELRLARVARGGRRPEGSDRVNVAVVKKREWSRRKLYLALNLCASTCVADGPDEPLDRSPDCLFRKDVDGVPR